jgi:hypothetical protein
MATVALVAGCVVEVAALFVPTAKVLEAFGNFVKIINAAKVAGTSCQHSGQRIWRGEQYAHSIRRYAVSGSSSRSW